MEGLNLKLKKLTENSVTDYSGEEPKTTVYEISYSVLNGEERIGDARVTNNGFSVSAFGIQAETAAEVDALLNKMFSNVMTL